MIKTLYQLKIEELGYSKLISVVSHRGGLSVQSEAKVVPPIIEYNEEGKFRVLEIQDVLKEVKRHPYRPGPKFPEERLADLEVSNLMSHLESYPTMPSTINSDGTVEAHEIAKLFYSNIVFFRRTESLEEVLKTKDYVERMEFISTILDKVGKDFYEQTELKLDFFSVTKRQAGDLAFIAGESGIGSCLRKISFGYHDLIPCDRIGREISSLKSAEKFLHPNYGSIKVPKSIKNYVTVLRVGVIGTKHSMLDSGDLMESGRSKVSCHLTRREITTEWDLIDPEKRNLVTKPFKSGINVVHEEIIGVNEDQEDLSCIRLVSPGGIKIAAQYHKNTQAVDEEGKNVDLLLEFDTIAKKGALFLFALNNPEFDPKGKTHEDLVEEFYSSKTQNIYLNDSVYNGYILEIPFFRPGQRYTELCTAKDNISVDMISKSITNKEYNIPSSVSEEYNLLRDMLLGIGELLEKEPVFNDQANEETYAEATY